MKKQEIKRDPIRDRIIQTAQYISDNSRFFWGGLGVVGCIILLATFISNKNNQQLLDSNLKVGILQNEAVYGEIDSSLIRDFENLLNTMKPSESYNQAFIYVLNEALANNNIDKVNSLLNDNEFNSDDNMLNAFVYKVQGDINIIDNPDKSISFYNDAIYLVPSYDLKVAYSVDLINLYIDQSKLTKANDVLDDIKSITENIDNLPISAKNNLDYIEYKLKQLNK